MTAIFCFYVRYWGGSLRQASIFLTEDRQKNYYPKKSYQKLPTEKNILLFLTLLLIIWQGIMV